MIGLPRVLFGGADGRQRFPTNRSTSGRLNNRRNDTIMQTYGERREGKETFSLFSVGVVLKANLFFDSLLVGSGYGLVS